MDSQKLETLVNFPLEGLDMAPFVLSEQQKQNPLIYDCFAVSNHYGGVGGGHYTAFGKNIYTNEWYDFDDSSCSPVTGDASYRRKSIVSEAAYSLFYRMRGHVPNVLEVDHDAIRQEPEPQFI